MKTSSLGDSEEPTILFTKANRAEVGYAITADPNGVYFKVREWGGLYKTKTLSWKNPVEPGIWHHVALVIDRHDNRLRAWVDGQQVPGTGILAPGSFICEGRFDLTMGGSTEVTFAEASIYTSALTQSEILALFRQIAGRTVIGPHDAAKRTGMTQMETGGWKTARAIRRISVPGDRADAGSGLEPSGEWNGGIADHDRTPRVYPGTDRYPTSPSGASLTIASRIEVHGPAYGSRPHPRGPAPSEDPSGSCDPGAWRYCPNAPR